MAAEKIFFRSTVAGLIDFKPEENPSWRTSANQSPSTCEMLKEILKIRQKWDSVKLDHSRDGFVDKTKRQLEAKFFYHCNVEEEHGLQSVDEIEKLLKSTEGVLSKDNEFLSFEEQETVNLSDAYLYLKKESETADLHYRGLLEESMLREVNRIILRNITRQKCYTKAGVYSNNARVTLFKGELYYYQQPDDMQEAVCLLLDRYNSLFTQSMSKTDEVQKLQGIFKSVAWLVYELLDLHPFSDGNGRLCRLLCSYVLSTCTPFPSPIYNMHSESSKQDFVNALVDARNSVTRYPRDLTTMIIESNWASWKKLEKKLEEELKEELNLKDKVIKGQSSQSCKSSRENDVVHHNVIPSCA